MTATLYLGQDPRERFHTLQLWSREGACRGIAYPRILEFEFNASGTILLHFPEPWFAMALEGTRLAELWTTS
jgi:hypothetical protein